MRMALLLFFSSWTLWGQPVYAIVHWQMHSTGWGYHAWQFLITLPHGQPQAKPSLEDLSSLSSGNTVFLYNVCVCARAQNDAFSNMATTTTKRKERERERARERESTSWLRYVVPVGTGCSLPPPPPHPNTSERARFKTPIVIIFIHRILLSSNKQLSDGGNWTSLRL